MTSDPQPPALETIQRWMQTVIMHPEGAEQGVDSPEARREIDVSAENVESVISRSHALTSLERLSIYADGYFLRLVECLQQEFRAVAQFVGDEEFETVAYWYVADCPSTSHTLTKVGERFPEYLAENRPERETDDGTPDWADFMCDLARLERHYSEVFDGPGIEKRETLQADDVLGIPQEIWQQVRFETAPCLRLATFQFPVQIYASEVRKKKKDPEIPPPEETHLAISRINYRVRRWTLSREEFLLLESILAGRSLMESLQIAFADAEEDDAVLAEKVSGWFQEWTEAGFFVSVRLDEA